MTDEQKKIYESYFGVPYEEITDEDRRAFEETVKYKAEILAITVRNIWEPIAAYFRKIAKALLAWKKDVDERALGGEPDAQYVRLSCNLITIELRIENVEKKLQYTKKSTARKPLIEQKKRLEARHEEIKQQLVEVGRAIDEDRKTSSRS